MLKYIEFKSTLDNLQKPETFINNFKEEMTNATKEKFKDGMNRTLKKCYEINQREGKGLHESKSTQTDQLCQAVKYLHNHSVIHRDIKPENILVTLVKIFLSSMELSNYVILVGQFIVLQKK